LIGAVLLTIGVILLVESNVFTINEVQVGKLGNDTYVDTSI
jgi:uncharacterized membrane protein